jgi:hypothetical protein
MTDFSTFDPGSTEALFRALLREGERALGRSLDDVRSVAAHLRSLAEASLETATALAEGRIDAETAREAFESRRQVLLQMRDFAALAALQAAPLAADAIFEAIGWAIYNRTGVNLAPRLVAPG